MDASNAIYLHASHGWKGISDYHPLITKDAYFEQTAVDYSKIWGKGVLKRMAAALIKENELSKDDIQDLKDYLDEFDSMGH